MGLLSRASDRLLTSTVLLLVSGSLLAASVAGVGAWAVLSLLSVETGAFGALLPLFVLGAFVTLPLTVLFGALVAAGLAAWTVSAVTGDRVRRVASALARESDVGRAVGLADLVESADSRSPARRADDRIERLKQRYVEGVITESEFERQIRDVLDREEVAGERSSVIDEQLREARRERE